MITHDFSAQHLSESVPETLRKLAAAAEASSFDLDMYGLGNSVQAFEQELTLYFGKPSCSLCVTGTASQQSMLRVVMSKKPGRPAALHPTSHMVWLDCLTDGAILEAGFSEKCAENLGVDGVMCGEAHRVMTFKDVEACLGQEPRPALLAVELGQRMNGGASMCWDDLLKTRALCSTLDVWLHMDGARLWEAAPGYGRTCAEIASPFDSVYVSFYKGLGAISGAALLGPSDFIASSKTWLKRMGTVAFSCAPVALSCRECFRKGSSEFPDRLIRLREFVEALSTDPFINKVVRFDPPVPQSCLVHCYVHGEPDALEVAHARVQHMHTKLWGRLRGCGHTLKQGHGGEQYFEWSMGPQNASLPLEALVDGWKLIAASVASSCAKEHAESD